MNFWNKITLGTKFLFGGWESALDYLLGFLNQYLEKKGLTDDIKKLQKTLDWALGWATKIGKYVPNKWRNEYFAICDIIADIISVCEDGKLTTDEVKALSEAFAEAKRKWEEDDEDIIEG